MEGNIHFLCFLKACSLALLIVYSATSLVRGPANLAMISFRGFSQETQTKRRLWATTATPYIPPVLPCSHGLYRAVILLYPATCN